MQGKRTNESADKALGSPFELARTSRKSGYDKIYRVMHGGFVNDNGGKRYHPTEKPIRHDYDTGNKKDTTQR